MRQDVLDCLRCSDWAGAVSLIKRGQASLEIDNPGSSVFSWLIEINFPSQRVVEFLAYCVRVEGIDKDSLQLLEFCLCESSLKSNAFDTFASLLDFGLSPNVLADGGCTLLQKAIELNKVREVEELLRHGVDPQQMNFFGLESTSNIEDAISADNAAGNLVLEKFCAPQRH